MQVEAASAACVAECVSVSWDKQLEGEWQPVHRQAQPLSGDRSVTDR